MISRLFFDVFVLAVLCYKIRFFEVFCDKRGIVLALGSLKSCFCYFKTHFEDKIKKNQFSVFRHILAFLPYLRVF